MMDANAKKTALRMIPYGLYVLMAESKEGKVGAGTVNWVTQVSFEPPLVALGLRADSSIYGIIQEARAFSLNILGKGQQSIAFAFFKPVQREGDTIGGQAFRSGSNGAPILKATPAFVECSLRETLAAGDHAIVIGEVVEAGVANPFEGRPDDATLMLKDLGEKTFYGG